MSDTTKPGPQPLDFLAHDLSQHILSSAHFRAQIAQLQATVAALTDEKKALLERIQESDDAAAKLKAELDALRTPQPRTIRPNGMQPPSGAAAISPDTLQLLRTELVAAG